MWLFPSQQIRYPVEEKGRWVPLERQSYLDDLVRPDQPLDDGIAAPH